jgi:hypothetical protein
MANYKQLLLAAAEACEFTYVGIGSNPHAASLVELSAEWDQLMPVFVREQLHKTVRVIHFDPAFANNLEFVKTYFTTKYPGLYHQYANEIHTWASPRLEIHILCETFEHKDKWHPEAKDDEWFLAALSNLIVAQRGHLVVQDFSGASQDESFKAAYKASSQPHLFKRRVLFDVTYGNASCQTNLTVHKPIYDSRGDFINFTLFDHHEIQEVIGQNPRVDKLARRYFIEKYRSILNFHHVNYRRRVKGDTCLNNCGLYDDTSAPALIMDILQGELSSVLTILKRLAAIDATKETQFHALMDKYASVDMYDWNTMVNKLV